MKTITDIGVNLVHKRFQSDLSKVFSTQFDALWRACLMQFHQAAITIFLIALLKNSELRLPLHDKVT